MDNTLTYNGYSFYAIIHTVQIRIPTGNVKLTDELEKKEYIKSVFYRNGAVWAIVNPNNYPNKDNGYIRCLSNMKKAFDEIMKVHGIIEYSIYRVDVAINTGWEYSECYKLNCYLNNLDAIRSVVNNDYYTNDFNFDKRTVKNKKGGYEFEIYNKAIESNGRDESNTRLEFRFIDYKNLTFENAIERTIDILNKLPKYIDKTNSKRIKALNKRYEIEREKGIVINLTEFVARHNEFIYNTKILNGIYNYCMNGDISSWLYKYKKPGHTIELYNKSDLLAYLNVLKNALNEYYKT